MHKANGISWVESVYGYKEVLNPSPLSAQNIYDNTTTKINILGLCHKSAPCNILEAPDHHHVNCWQMAQHMARALAGL